MTDPTKSREGPRLASIDMCTGCGTCYAICPADAIDLRIDFRRGIYYPVANRDRCIDCDLCTEVCPRLSSDTDTLMRSASDSGPENTVIGHFESCYIGHSIDYRTRSNSASGGLVTAILIAALEEGIIDGALVTRMNDANPLLPEPFIARTRGEVLSASKSKYCPVPANTAVRELLNSDGRFAVVGLPCHLHGIRKAELVSEDLRCKIVLHMGLFCSHTLSFHGTHFLLKKLGIDPCDVTRLDYRGCGWPGGLTVRDREGNESYISNQSPLWNAIFRSHFFTPTACLWCTDLTSEMADLSFGDPWLPDFLEKERVGKSIVISRTRLGEDLLRITTNRRDIELELFDARRVVTSQATYAHLKKSISPMRQGFYEGRRPLSAGETEERVRMIERVAAIITVLNSSIGCNRVWRHILERTPSELLYWYSACLDRILSLNKPTKRSGENDEYE